MFGSMIWDNMWPKRTPSWTDFLVGFLGPRPLGAGVEATPILLPIRAYVFRPFFWQSGWNFAGTKEIVIYRLLVRNQCYGDQFQIRFFGPLLAIKWAWSPCRRLRVWGLKPDQKVGPRLGPFLLFCHTLSQNHAPELNSIEYACEL